MKKAMLPVILCLLFAGCARALPADARQGDFRDLPVIMYHCVLQDPARTGKYVISPARLEEDVVWLQQNGYTIVTAHAIAEFAQGSGTLPEKPVLLTFDDGYYNNMTYVLPILTKHDCTAVIGIVGAYAQRYTEAPDPNPNYGYLSWEEIYALVLSGRFELSNHTFNMHGETGRKGSARRDGESDAAYARAFTSDLEKLQRALLTHTYVEPEFFAYPFGVVDRDSRGLLREMGFAGSFTCSERISRVTAGKPESLWELGRFNRAGDMTTEAFMKKMGL